MNPQVTQPYPQNPVSKLASWDYAAGGLHPMDYNNRLSAIMVATMWLFFVHSVSSVRVICIHVR